MTNTTEGLNETKLSQSVSDVLRSIKGEPNCQRSGCHGRGYLGIRVYPDGSQQVIICRCGRVGESDYKQLTVVIERVGAEILKQRELNDRMALYFIARLDAFEGRTLAGKIKRLREWIRRKPKEETPAPATSPTQEVPVNGEVRA